MRRHITLIENLQQTGFKYFYDEWADYVLSLDSELEEGDLAELYHQYMPEISELGRVPLYRGVNVSDEWVTALLDDALEHVGIFWSTDLSIATSFSPSEDNYDERFERQKRGQNIILQARDIDLKIVDVNATLASMMATSEREIRLHEGKPIFIASALINGQWHLIGKTLLT